MDRTRTSDSVSAANFASVEAFFAVNDLSGASRQLIILAH